MCLLFEIKTLLGRAASTYTNRLALSNVINAGKSSFVVERKVTNNDVGRNF